MNWSLKLFKVKEIDIQVHLTFVLILVWAAYRGGGNTGAAFGIVATLLLFLSITLHELGHSFQALKYGVKVRDITLMPMLLTSMLALGPLSIPHYLDLKQQREAGEKNDNL